ncbi:MAG TPA: hypothetical protein VGS10_12430 [Terracidiphilus sp.]|nr:hypothetical protein [Terracidiphilus sp.]
MTLHPFQSANMATANGTASTAVHNPLNFSPSSRAGVETSQATQQMSPTAASIVVIIPMRLSPS